MVKSTLSAVSLITLLCVRSCGKRPNFCVPCQLYGGVQLCVGEVSWMNWCSSLHQIDSTWIAYNKPKDNQPTNEHAGFLMALGLNGHISSLAFMNLHDYLCMVRCPWCCLIFSYSRSFSGKFRSGVAGLGRGKASNRSPPPERILPENERERLQSRLILVL